MFQIDTTTNRIKRLEKKLFSDLGFSERYHLQEWLAHEPLVFGEDLLIIQKEFDGFSETNERLDLLGLDKNGMLVVIENKLDDSGRDVVWQALKYASYCSTLKKDQIVEIFQSYLDKCCGGGDAQKLLCDFLEVPDLAEVVMNSGNNQRLILVAAQFRKEVTSTVLWLLSNGLRLQCFKATPYSLGNELFLQIEQIIPTPEAAEFMIGINEKEAAEKATESQQKSRHRIRLDFWTQALEKLKTKTDLYKNVSPSREHWLSAGSGVSGCPYNLIFGTKIIRVEMQIFWGSQAENKYIFDHLLSQKELIQSTFGDNLSWERLDDRISSYIRYGKSVEGDNRENWPEIIEWFIEHIIKLESAFKKPLSDAYSAMKKAGVGTTALEVNGEQTSQDQIAV
ncbi:DUF4268 domain-containing protein [Geomonas paludis]|uniref:DUF4268 domain-containing protein n=1 Tax=Geomonas paludis TaxID=2740185 RepID=A0ABY4LIX4_9BACT|nr:DUF4268 domain-containing protein [Geomonas paludis]UPU37812.1 DUF4268 domain-containing protein [Geomonas paludis]